MAPLSAPGAGGELKSEPTTEKRNRAHRLALDGCDGWVITDPPSVGETESVRPYRPSTRGRDAHLLRIFRDHHETLIDRAPGIVTGDRNRSSRCQSSCALSAPRRNASTIDRGSSTISTTGVRRARCAFPKSVSGNCSHQKTCHRALVRRSAPKRWESSRAARGVGPCRKVVTKMTTRPR